MTPLPDEPRRIHSAAETAAGYDRIASAYAAHLQHELESKPFDRAFLERFASALPRGEVLDLGCGPGHVGRFLRECGASVRGADLSLEMARIAASPQTGIESVQCDMRALPFAAGSLAGVAAFYAVIHLDPSELTLVFEEMRRVLRPEGLLAVSFHVGDEVRHVEELWGVHTSLDFVFLDPHRVERAMRSAGFGDIQVSQRGPYGAAVESQTHRCYLLAKPSA